MISHVCHATSFRELSKGVFAYFLQLYIPFSSVGWKQTTKSQVASVTSFRVLLGGTRVYCNKNVGWKASKDVSRERKQEGNLPRCSTHPPPSAYDYIRAGRGKALSARGG